MEFGPILRAMSRAKARFGLIVLEIALTLAIVANCVNMIRAARKEMAKPSGFDDESILVVTSLPFDAAFRDDGVADAAVARDVETLRGMPDVVSATNTRFLPWQGGGSSSTFWHLGGKGEKLWTQLYSADDGTLATLGVHLVAGRNFRPGEAQTEAFRLRELLKSSRAMGVDGKPAEKYVEEVIISREFARKAFGKDAPLGERIEDNDGDQYVVVGVLDPFYNPYGFQIREDVLLYAGVSSSFDGGARYLVRARPGRLEALRKALEPRLLALNGGRNLKFKPLVEIRSRYHSANDLTVRTLTSVIFLLVFITGLGIVGLTSFSVGERTRQIGTRRALGARKGDIVRYFLLENWIVTSFGLTLGVLLAVGLNVLLVTKLGAPRLDPSLLVSGVFLLWGAGLLATLFPALRGSRIAPAIATRNV